MYPEVIKHTYLNKSQLNIRDQYGNTLPYESEIGDYADTNGNQSDMPDSDFVPDYHIEGFFRQMPEGKQSEFIIAYPGNCTMYITGVPRNALTIEPFRMGSVKSKIYSSYWEDPNRGYLFQIIIKPQTKQVFIP